MLMIIILFNLWVENFPAVGELSNKQFINYDETEFPEDESFPRESLSCWR